MKRHLIWLTAIGAAVAVAYAQSVIVRGAYGLGFASGSNAERPDCSGARWRMRATGWAGDWASSG